MLKRIAVGGLAGALATVPQSGVVWGLRHAGVYRSQPPPERVSEHLTGRVIDLEALPRSSEMAIMLAQHFGFGAGCGALFGLVTGAVRPTVAAGVLVGLAIWKLSYDGWIPALRIMPPPEGDEEGRVFTMITAHVVYGLALGLLMQRWADKH